MLITEIKITQENPTILYKVPFELTTAPLRAQHNPLGFEGSLNTMKLGKTAAVVSSVVNLIYFIFTAVWVYNHGFQDFKDYWLGMLFLR